MNLCTFLLKIDRRRGDVRWSLFGAQSKGRRWRCAERTQSPGVMVKESRLSEEKEIKHNKANLFVVLEIVEQHETHGWRRRVVVLEVGWQWRQLDVVDVVVVVVGGGGGGGGGEHVSAQLARAHTQIALVYELAAHNGLSATRKAMKERKKQKTDLTNIRLQCGRCWQRHFGRDRRRSRCRR